MATWGPFVEGSVEPIIFTAEEDGTPIDLDDYGTITPVLKNSAGTAVASPGTAVKVSPQTDNVGKFTYTPASSSYNRTAGIGALLPEKFTIRFSILDSGNTPRFFPGGAADIINVFEP